MISSILLILSSAFVTDGLLFNTSPQDEQTYFVSYAVDENAVVGFNSSPYVAHPSEVCANCNAIGYNHSRHSRFVSASVFGGRGIPIIRRFRGKGIPIIRRFRGGC